MKKQGEKMANQITLKERIRALEVKMALLCQKVTDLDVYVKTQFENHLKTLGDKEKEERGYKHDWLTRIVVAIIALLQALMFAWLIMGKR